MLAYLFSLLRRPAPAPAALILETPKYVGHETQEGLYSSAAEMKTFMDVLKLPEGCTWFFLQPGKNEVKLTSKAKAELIRDCIQEQRPELAVELRTYAHGISKYSIIRFGWRHNGGILNDWGIEISNPY